MKRVYSLYFYIYFVIGISENLITALLFNIYEMIK